MGPTTLALLFVSASQMYDLPPGLLSAVCYVESKHTVGAMHRGDGHSDSIGICQIKLETARFFHFKGTAEQLQDPTTNIKYAAAYLRYQTFRYKCDFKKAVAAYNAGRYNKNMKGLPRNNQYVTKVFTAWGEGR